MPFSTVDRFNIKRHLRVQLNAEKSQEIDTLLTQLEQTSEQLVQQVLGIVQRLEQHQTETAQAATGLTKVDVIEWKPERMCDVYRYRKELQRELANAIGFNLPIEQPWGDAPVNLARSADAQFNLRLYGHR